MKTKNYIILIISVLFFNKVIGSEFVDSEGQRKERVISNRGFVGWRRVTAKTGNFLMGYVAGGYLGQVAGILAERAGKLPKASGRMAGVLVGIPTGVWLTFKLKVCERLMLWF